MTDAVLVGSDTGDGGGRPPPGRFTSADADALRELYESARCSQEWTDLAVALDRYRAAAVAQTRLGTALGISASHIHHLIERHLPTDREPAPAPDWSGGNWVTTAVAAHLLDIAPSRLSRYRPQAVTAAITCKAGARRVWHAPSLVDWWGRTALDLAGQRATAVDQRHLSV